jgi:hypothetical protein
VAAAVAAETQAASEDWAPQAAHGLSLRWYASYSKLHAAQDGRLTMRDPGRVIVISKTASSASSTACSGRASWSAAATRATAASST